MKSRVRLENLAIKKGIIQPHEKTTESLIELLLLNYLLNKRQLNIIAGNLDIKKPNKLSSNELVNIFKNYLTVKKLEELGLNTLRKRHIQIKELDRIQKLNELSHDVLKKLGELQRIKNYNTLSKENLIYALLRSQNPNEDNYINHITSNINTRELDNELRYKINDIKQLVIRLGGILTNKKRKEITRELYESLKKINNTNPNTRLRKRQKENLLKRLIEQNNLLVKKERFMHIDHDDLQYQGISDIKNAQNYIEIDSYYDPELIASAYERSYEGYRINGDKTKELTLNDYLNTVRPNVKDLITKKKVNERKVQLAISIIFLNYITNDTAEKYVLSDNVIIRPTDDINKITTELYNSLLHRYQETLENKMEGSSFVYDYVNFLDIKFNKVDLIRGGTYIKENKWLTKKKATINPKNNKGEDVYCFMYALTVALNDNETGCHPERINKIIPYISKYNWNRINFPSQRKDWELFERDNEDIALNILSIPHNKKTIELQYKSKYNRTRKNQVVLLMITDGEKWHYLALKSIPTNDGYMKPTQSISRLFNKITSTNTTNDYYCLNCFHSYSTMDKLKKHELVCDNHDYCKILIPDDKNKVLKYASGSKSLKMAHVIYVDIECQLVKDDTYSNDLTKTWSRTI